MTRGHVPLLRALGATGVLVPLVVLTVGVSTGTVLWLARQFVVATGLIGAALGIGTYLAVGTQPRNRVVHVTGLASALMAVEIAGYLVTALSMPPGTLTGGTIDLAPVALPTAAAWGLWVGYTTWLPALGLLLTFGVLWFPDGDRPDRPWRLLEPLAVLGMAAAAAGYAIVTWPTSATPYADAVADPGGTAGMLLNLGRPLTVVAVFGAMASLFVRHRRASGQRKQQLRVVGILFGFLAVGLTVTGATIAMGMGYTLGLSISTVVAPVIVAGYITALLRYRIYDVDVVISRTLVVAGSGAFITGVYVALVVGVGRLVDATEGALWLPVTATAIVAVAFQPVRERLTHAVNRLVYGDRATPYEVLSRTSRATTEGTTDEVLEQLAALIEDATGAEASLGVVTGERVRPIAGRPLPAVGAAAHIEWIVHGERRLGMIALVPRRGESLNDQHLELVARLASAAGALLHNQSLTADLEATVEELEASRGRLLAAADGARRMIEAELRSGPEEVLSGLCLRLSKAVRSAGHHAPHTAQVLAGLVDDAARTAATVRQLASGAYPPLLGTEGLVVAIRARSAGLPFPVTVQGAGVGRHDPETEAAVYFCVLEAMQNAAKHATPSAIDVRLTDADGHLHFEVRDDGVGFDVNGTAEGMGLRNMVDRLDALGGRLEVTSAPATGTTVTGEVPTGREPSVSAPSAARPAPA